VEAVRKPPASMEELRRLYEDGFRYYVIDYNRIVYTYYQMERVEIMDRVAKDLEPTFNVSNTFILGPAFAFEGNLYFWKTLEILEKARDEEMDRIRVYDLREYFGSPPPPDQGEGESRDPLAPHRQDPLCLLWRHLVAGRAVAGWVGSRHLPRLSCESRNPRRGTTRATVIPHPMRDPGGGRPGPPSRHEAKSRHSAAIVSFLRRQEPRTKHDQRPLSAHAQRRSRTEPGAHTVLRTAG
jgi:hypothetical protein